jgi:hypothetical protein
MFWPHTAIFNCYSILSRSWCYYYYYYHHQWLHSSFFLSSVAFLFHSLGPGGPAYQTDARPLPTHRTTQTQTKHTQTSMPRVGTEHMISVLEQAKAVHALDGSTTMIDTYTPLQDFNYWDKAIEWRTNSLLSRNPIYVRKKHI